MSYKIEALPDSHADLGEGPHWDIETQSLYYVDIDNGMIYRYDYQENKVYKCKIENETLASFIIPIENATNKFAVGVGRRVGIVNWDGKSASCTVEKNLFEVENDENFKTNRLNDGKCDPTGRLYAGTMRYVGDMLEKRCGSFYRFEQNGSIVKLKGDIGISNGLTWNEKTKKFYYIDSVDYEVKEYDYDINTGEIKNPKILIDFRGNDKQSKNLPDGMTIDSNGFLYVATFGGSKIFKINPADGKIEMEIKLPCEQITSCAFGGPKLDILYVTTSAINGKQDPAGNTFKITGLNATGLPMTKLKA